ncbi:hypothetical protein AB6802_28100 [Mesorhizobium sp. RCC_202]|uniref:hypothetical protein n=1 Tax=Mesorhizobium sp. RCC_202 TaxID=3239222 RepID=UPI0035233DEA
MVDQPCSQMRIALGFCLASAQFDTLPPGLRDEASMWLTALLAFLAGVFGSNGVPHFVSGITKGSYPCLFGNSAIPNLIAGWTSLVVASLFAYMANFAQYPIISLVSAAIGVLLMGLFHAAGLAFGRKS